MCRRTANDSGAADNAVAVRSGGLKHRRSMHSRRMRRPHVPACFPPKGEIFRELPRRRPEPFQNAFENDQGIRRRRIDHREVEASDRRGRLEFAAARRRDAGAMRRAQRRCRFARHARPAQRVALVVHRQLPLGAAVVAHGDHQIPAPVERFRAAAAQVGERIAAVGAVLRQPQQSLRRRDPQVAPCALQHVRPAVFARVRRDVAPPPHRARDCRRDGHGRDGGGADRHGVAKARGDRFKHMNGAPDQCGKREQNDEYRHGEAGNGKTGNGKAKGAAGARRPHVARLTASGECRA